MPLASTYEWRGSASLWWYNMASDLRGAAAAIWYAACNDPPEVRKLCNFGKGYRFDIALPGVFHLNAGLSLELLLKAIIVHNQNGDFKNIPHIHDLIKLAEVAQITQHLTENQKATLAVFSEAISWEGKYPVPKKEDQYTQNSKRWDKMVRPAGGTGKLIITEANPETWPSLENYNKLWDLICGKYFQIREEEEEEEEELK
jgi:hypothetical protein